MTLAGEDIAFLHLGIGEREVGVHFHFPFNDFSPAGAAHCALAAERGVDPSLDGLHAVQRPALLQPPVDLPMGVEFMLQKSDRNHP